MEKIIEHKNNFDNKGTILVNTSDVVHPLSEDDMVIFPATLHHEVPKQEETDELRICVVTNIELFKS